MQNSTAPTMKHWRDAIAVYSDRRLLVILLMGFSSGLPLALTGKEFRKDTRRR